MAVPSEADIIQTRATNLSLFKHQFTFKPVAKSSLYFLYVRGRCGSHVFALAGLSHIVCRGRLSCKIAVFNESEGL